jgi:uracil-DNA glycosylase
LIFNAYQQANIEDIRVVIMGQDPYIKHNEAMGMSFSIPKGTKVPPSLVNIYHALNNDQDVDFKMPPNGNFHGDLTAWGKQGVFMLNAVLTVEAGKSNSHAKKGWESFTKQTIRAINKKCSNVVYLLWGKKAHETAVLVNKENNHVILEVHPSPLAGHGFKTSKCFS